MLKRTMICVCFFYVAQSLTLLADELDASAQLESNALLAQVDGPEPETLEPAVKFEAPAASVPVLDNPADNNEEPNTISVAQEEAAAVESSPTDSIDETAPLAAVTDEQEQTTEESAENNQTLNEQVQNLKQQVLELNKDLFILEEELLFPANTQVAVFVSMNVGDFFQLDAVKLTIDDKLVTSYLYTGRQLDALHRGGVQRLYLGNLKTGEHEMVAVFTGRGPKGRDYRRASTVQFEKTSQIKQIELKIVDSTATQQPEFVVKEW
ncbi:MAG: hypothetical protein JKY66_10345 [Spongiibacteraceae bacterium]|nr:hypothetical protein [Spongiibacteraceae bacterium]